MPPATLFTGKTLEDAVKKGLEALGLSRAEAMITVIEEGSGGFLGLGARPYRVRIMPRPGGAIREPEERESRGRRERGERSTRESRPARRRGGERGGAAATAPRGERRPRGDEKRAESGAEARPERRGEGRPERRGEGRGDRKRPDERRGGERREDDLTRRSDAAAAKAQPPRSAGHPGDSASEGRRDEPRAPIAVGAGDAAEGSRGGEPRDADDAERRRRRRGRRGGRGRSGGGRGGERTERPVEGEIEPVFHGGAEGSDLPMPATSYASASSASAAPPSAPSRHEAAPMSDETLAPISEEERPSFEPSRPSYENARPSYESSRPSRENSRPPREPATPALSSEALAAEGRRWSEDLLRAMGFDAQVSATAEGDRVDVVAEVATDDELLTGPKGEVRQALQHLLNRMVNRGEGSRYHLQLEINDFWKRREEELERLARQLADEAVTNQSEAVTEYLNAQERRIIHVALREDTRVKTYALGDGMIKRLAVAPADYPEGGRDE